MALAHPELVAYLELLTTRCKKHYGGELLSLVLYGSVVRGTFRPTSDLDLLVVLRGSTLSWGKRISQFLGGVLDHAGVEKAQARLRQLSLPWRIEPIILTERELAARPPILLDLTEDAMILRIVGACSPRRSREFGSGWRSWGRAVCGFRETGGTGFSPRRSVPVRSSPYELAGDGG